MNTSAEPAPHAPEDATTAAANSARHRFVLSNDFAKQQGVCQFVDDVSTFTSKMGGMM